MDEIFKTTPVWGILTLIGFLAFVIVYVFSQLRKQHFALTDDWLKADSTKIKLLEYHVSFSSNEESPLYKHKIDPDAHEAMRNKVSGSFDEHFSTLEQMILNGQALQTEELSKFKKEVLDNVFALSNRMLDKLIAEEKKA